LVPREARKTEAISFLQEPGGDGEEREELHSGVFEGESLKRYL
jgi:hypothetical protein